MDTKAHPYEYRREIFQSPDWADAILDGWRTIAVNSEGIAMLQRKR